MTDRPIRIQRKRTKGWRMPADTIYVGRPTAFSNPYSIGKLKHLSWFRRDLLREAGAAPTEPHPLARHFWRMAQRLPELRGKNLACWCPLNQPCHAGVLLEMANREEAP